jgi:shikimate dehydrogenase
MISAVTNLYGVVGNPIEHSLSPLLHNTLAKEMGLDMVYVAFNVREDIESAIDGAFALGIKGMNVTIPYKQDMLELVTKIDERAQRIGAVNTLVRDEEGFIGYNTDITGLRLALKNNDLSVMGKNVIILGAGGAAKAALYLAIAGGALSITIINRNVNKAVELKKEFKGEYRHIEVLSLDELKSNINILKNNNYFVFQTTNVGMYPFINECLIDNEEFYKKCEGGIDLIYTPEETVFIKKMKEQGKKCINGLDMLIMQGVAAFELWHNIRISKETIARVKNILIEKLRERIK